MELKTLIYPKVVIERDSLVQALDSQKMVIYIEDPLYEEMYKELSRNIKGKTAKGLSAVGATVGLAALLGGSLLAAPLGLLVILASAAGGIAGASMDKLKEYSVKIDSVKRRIVLIKASGQNKFNKRRHEISNSNE